MFDVNSALNVMKKYGYDSTSLHPFLYKKDNSIGICYSFVDDNFGILERIFLFSTLEEMDEFLKELHWFKQNGKANNVRMILENYETVNPKVIYLRNEKIMMKGEMFNIEQFDAMEAQKKEMDEMSRILLESSNLLAYYDSVKKGQMDYFSMMANLRNDLRQRYYNLQKEVDTFNKVELDRPLRLLPTSIDNCGISIPMEIVAKDRLSQYKSVNPPVEEAVDFIKDVWELNMNLELNDYYFKSQLEENSIQNEMVVVNKKMDLMKEINKKKNYFFGVDLVGKFRKINRECKENANVLTQEYIDAVVNNIKSKYSYYDKIDYLSACNYLKEATQNNNYDILAQKYSVKEDVVEELVRWPMEKIIADLTNQYLKLQVSEQAIMTLYNSKLKKLFDYILEIPGFYNVPIINIINILNNKEDFTKIKAECYDNLMMRLDEAANLNIKSRVFNGINFTSFETFVQSIVNLLSGILNIDGRMILNSDVTLYFKLENLQSLETKYIYSLTNDLNSLVASLKKETDMIGLVLLKKGTPVIFSPYGLEMSGLENKGMSGEFKIVNSEHVNLIVDVNDVIFLRDNNFVNVVKYFSHPIKENGISIVDEMKISGKTTFCKFTMTNKLLNQQSVAVNKVPAQS